MPTAALVSDTRLPPARDERVWRRGHVIAAVMAAVVLAMYWQLWAPMPEARRALRWDALWEYWGDLQIQVRALEQAQWPLWNPYERMGYPFYADPQAGTLYPLQWPLIAAGRAMGEVPYWLIVVKHLFHIWLLGVGMALWLRRQALGTAACYLGALLLLASYAVVVNAPSALNWSFAYTPWLLLAGERLLWRPRAQEGVVLGVVVALMVGAGALGAVWYGMVIAVPWLLVGFVGRPSGSCARKVMQQTALAAAVVVALCGAQAWATMDLVPQTERALRGADFYTQSGMTPGDVANLLVPGRPGMPTYLGLLPMALAVAAFLMAPRRQAVWVGMLVMGVVLALGDATPVLRWMGAVLPPVELFRMAHRYLYVAGFAFAVLAAWGLHGLDVWAQTSLRWRPRARWVVMALLVLCGLEQYAARHDVVRGGLAAVPTMPHDEVVRGYLLRHPDARVHDRGWLGYRPGARLTVRDFGGYEDDPLALLRYARVRNWVRQDPHVAGRIGVAYMGFDAENWRRWPLVAKPAEMRELAPRLFAYKHVAPNAWWTPAAKVAPDAKAAFARFAEGKGADAFVEAAHAKRVPIGNAPAVAPDGIATMTHHAPHVVRYAVRAPARGILVVNEMYVERGWTATVNGAPAPIAAINGYARGVAVPAGEVVVQLNFDLPAFRQAATATVVAWALVVVWLCGVLLGRRR